MTVKTGDIVTIALQPVRANSTTGEERFEVLEVSHGIATLHEVGKPAECRRAAALRALTVVESA